MKKKFDTPKTASIKKLAAKIESHGLDGHVAKAIARTVAEPDEFRKKLLSPVKQRVKGGTLKMIQTEVFSLGVVPYICNPRIQETLATAASGDKNSQRPLDNPTGVPNKPHAAELVARVDNVDNLKALQNSNATAVARTNNYESSVSDVGVLQPVILSPMTLHVPGRTPVTFLTSVDGSSRTNAAYKTLGVGADEAIFPLAVNDKVTSRITAAINEAHNEEKEARINAATLPALIIIGYEPDDTSAPDYPKTIDGLLSLFHVEAPKQWSRGAQNELVARKAVEALVADGVWTPEFGQWAIGNMDPETAAQHGFLTKPDERGVTIQQAFMHPNATQSVNKGIRSILFKHHCKRPYRMELAIELALLTLRHKYNPEFITSVRSALVKQTAAKGLFPANLTEITWEVTGKDPDDILKGAIEELQTETTTNRMELLGLGLWNLIIPGGTTRGRGIEPLDMAEDLVNTQHGLHILHRAIKDGRNEAAGIKMVDETGQVVTNKDGNPVELSEIGVKDLKEILKNAGKIDIPTNEDPTVTHNKKSAELGEAVRSVATILNEIKEIKDSDGKPLVDTYGIDPELVSLAAESLDNTRITLLMYGSVAKKAANV